MARTSIIVPCCVCVILYMLLEVNAHKTAAHARRLRRVRTIKTFQVGVSVRVVCRVDCNSVVTFMSDVCPIQNVHTTQIHACIVQQAHTVRTAAFNSANVHVCSLILNNNHAPLAMHNINMFTANDAPA